MTRPAAEGILKGWPRRKEQVQAGITVSAAELPEVLQPGVDLLERADDFPADGPILLITDGQCDVVRVRREHAWLIPSGASLPFTARGPVFRVQ